LALRRRCSAHIPQASGNEEGAKIEGSIGLRVIEYIVGGCSFSLVQFHIARTVHRGNVLGLLRDPHAHRHIDITMAQHGRASPPRTPRKSEGADSTDTGKAGASKATAGAVPLWRQLNAVAHVLIAVRSGKSWTTAQLDVENALRPGVQALSFAVLRHYGTALALRAALASRTPSAAADALLCSVLALALVPGEDGAADNAIVDDAAQTGSGSGARYEVHTLVNQAVEAAKRNPATHPQASFINACLRRFLREREALLVSAQRQPQAQWNHPTWWIQRLQREYPAQWQGILQANAFSAPLTLRINTKNSTPAHYQTALEAMNIEAQEVAHSGLQLDHSAYVPGLPGYAEGWFSVQDAAAQMAAPLLLDALSSEQAAGGKTLRVLDACAAPGGKTAHLLEYAASKGLEIEVLALDIDAARCQRIDENLHRLQLHAHIVVADAANPQTWWDGQQFDAILLDAPCTASGIVRRHPDIRWLRREADVSQLALQQQTLLNALWPLLKRGAPLLYCTCSVFKAEGRDQIQTFVARHTDAALLPSPGHLLPQSPPQREALPDNHLGEHDGFFYGLLQKTSLLS
jgi:16S rRNA (cytosine967-C5)-methyltransferase